MCAYVGAYFSKWMSLFVCLGYVNVYGSMCQPHIFLSVPIMHLLTPHPHISFPAPPVSLTISGRTQLAWQRCYRTLILLAFCTCCIVSCCTAPCRSPSLATWRHFRSLTTLLWSRWHFRACAFSTASPCSTSLPSRYSLSVVLCRIVLDRHRPNPVNAVCDCVPVPCTCTQDVWSYWYCVESYQIVV